VAFVFRAAGTSAVGNNVTSLTPGLPAGTVAGDLLIVQFQSFGGTGSRTPSVPGTWTSYVWTNGTAQHLVGWKIAGAGETAPTVTLTGTGVANDTQLARVHGFYSDASLLIALAVAGTNSTNASADNIGPVTGVTIPAGGGLHVITAGKTNDFNGNGSLTNYTQAALTESTTGNDAGLTLMYRLATPAGATGNLTVTDDGATASAGLGFGKMLAFVETPSDLIDIELLEGATVIQAWIDQEITTSIADLALALSPAAVASITDLTALRVRATKVGSSGYVRIYEVAVAITGTESVGGAALNASVSLIVSASGALAVAKPLAATANGVATSAGALTVAKPLAAAVATSVSTAADLTVAKPLAATGTVAITTTSALSVAKPLNAAALVTAATAGELLVAKPLAAAISAAATTAADLSVGSGLSASVSAQLTVTGALSVAKPLAGAVSSATSTLGALSVAKPLAGAVSAVVTTDATLAVGTGFSAAITAALTATAALTTAKPIDAAVTVTASSTAALSVAKPLTVAATVAVTTAAALSVAKPLDGSAALALAVSAALTAPRPLDGAVVVTVAAVGTVTVPKTLTGALTVTLTAVAPLTLPSQTVSVRVVDESAPRVTVVDRSARRLTTADASASRLAITADGTGQRLLADDTTTPRVLVASQSLSPS